jgi:hypothetical protein
LSNLHIISLYPLFGRRLLGFLLVDKETIFIDELLQLVVCGGAMMSWSLRDGGRRLRTSVGKGGGGGGLRSLKVEAVEAYTVFKFQVCVVILSSMLKLPHVHTVVVVHWLTAE